MKHRTTVLLASVVAINLSAGMVLAQQAAEEELRTLVAPEGFEVSLFASEPMVVNPAAIDVDTHGRVWVAEIQWYRAKAKEPPADKIKVLEDTDGDGRADKVTVFADGVFCPMSVCVAGDKVFVATSPDLWVYEDKNHDLVADGPPQKLLTGFGGRNSDHGAHSLVLGPDHKWWMSHGDTGFNLTGVDGSHIEYRFGAMLRGELDGSRLETVAVNFRNPYEICVSSFGEPFASDNDNDGNFSARICWIMEGGDYGWFGHPPAKVPPGTPFGEHWHFRGHVPGFVPATLVTGFGSPCGICFYEGDSFGPEFKNAPLHCDAGPREVRLYRHEKSGYGMKATSRVFLTSKSDNYFRPDDICAAPDSSLFVSDWYDGGVGGHAYNNPDQGRIFLLRPSDKTKLVRVGKPGPYAGTAEAIEGLKNPNLATQYLARERLLADGEASLPALLELVGGGEPNFQARALWVLDRIGGEARGRVVEQLKSSDDALRALAVRILRRHGEEYGDALLAMADDEAVEVRREVLLALPKLASPSAMAVLVKLASRYDGSDRYELEAINVAAAGRKDDLYAALAAAGKFSIENIELAQVLNPQAATEFLVRGLADTKLDDAARERYVGRLATIASVEAGRAVLKLVDDERAAPELRRSGLEALSGNLSESWKELRDTPELTAAVKKLLADANWQSRALALVGRNGLGQFGPEVLALATSAKTAAETRTRAVAVAAGLRAPGAAAALKQLLSDNAAEIRKAALAALVELQDWNALKRILIAQETSDDVRGAVVERLMSSTGGALVLLRLIDEQAVPEAVRQLAVAKAIGHPDSNVRVLYEKFIPADERPKRLGEAIQPAEILALAGDARRGERIFFESSAAQCKNCHRVHNLGGGVGPDLSMIGKKYERATLLETILQPSKAIAPEFVPYLLETGDGRVYVGFLAEKTAERVVLKDANGQSIAVPARDVELLEPQQKSLMPELVLRDVTAQDAADLLAFLTSLTHGVQPVTRYRVLGPFASPDKQGVDRDFGPDKQLAAPDLNASFVGADGKPCRWEVAEVDNTYGFPAVNQVKYAQDRGLPAEAVTNYFLVFADTDSEQDATLLVGSDDSCHVWVNGKLLHTYRGDRALQAGDDRVTARLRAGRNAIVIKVENHQGPGGVALSVGTSGQVHLKTE